MDLQRFLPGVGDGSTADGARYECANCGERYDRPVTPCQNCGSDVMTEVDG